MNPRIERNGLKRLLENEAQESTSAAKKRTLVNALHEVGNINAPNPVQPSVIIPTTAPSSIPATRSQQMIDERDKEIQVCFAPYAQRIVRNWLKTQDKYRCKPDFLNGQDQIKCYMRETLIDWIVTINYRFGHRRETLYLAVNIMDRYVNHTIQHKTDCVVRSDYQLVGITAYFIACKYEEIYYPDIANLLTYADNIYTAEQIKQMELKIANTLKFDFTVPTTNKFLGRFLRISNNRDFHYMCYMISDYMLQTTSMLAWKPSEQASATLYLARKYLAYEESWPKSFEEFTGMKKAEIIDCARAIHQTMVKAPRLFAIKHKYQSSRYNSIFNYAPFR